MWDLKVNCQTRLWALAVKKVLAIGWKITYCDTKLNDENQSLYSDCRKFYSY